MNPRRRRHARIRRKARKSRHVIKRAIREMVRHMAARAGAPLTYVVPALGDIPPGVLCELVTYERKLYARAVGL